MKMLRWFWRNRQDIISFLELALTLAITVLIVKEIRLANDGLKEAASQVTLLQQMNVNAQHQAENLKAMLGSQGDLLAAQRNLLDNIRQMNTTVADQLRVLREEQTALKDVSGALQQQAGLLKQQVAFAQQQWEKENQRPVLEVRAVNITPGIPGKSRPVWSTLLLTPNPRLDLGQVSDINMTVHGESHTYSELDLNVRNIGTGDAVNFILTPTPSQDVTVRCVDYGALGLYTRRTSGLFSDECAAPSGILPPILSRPKDRPAHMEDPGVAGTEFDPAFDAHVRINLTIPLDVTVFDLEFVVTADKLSPTRYMGHCHMPRR